LWEGKNTTWAWRLYKLDERRTRLVTRVHMHYDLMSPFRSLVRPRPLRHDAQDVAGHQSNGPRQVPEERRNPEILIPAWNTRSEFGCAHQLVPCKRRDVLILVSIRDSQHEP